MIPVLFQFGPITVYSYGLMLAIAVFVCAYFLRRDAIKVGLDGRVIYDFVFWCVVWGIIGARLFYIFLNLDYFIKEPLEIIMINRGGLAFQGGFLGGALAGLWFVKKNKWPLRLTLDLAAPYLALGQAIGRIGCFFNGCCYGKPVSWGPYFTVHQANLHPTQLYETLGLLIVFGLLMYARRYKLPSGVLFAFYLWGAAIERFIVEFFRADHQVTWFGLSLFQYVAIGIFMLGCFLYAAFISRRRSS